MLERSVILAFGGCFSNYISLVPNCVVLARPKYKKLNMPGSF